MAIEIQSSGSLKNGQLFTFTFSGPVSEFVVGIQQFTLAFDGDDQRKIASAQVSLLSPSMTGSTVTVTPSLQITDCDGHQGKTNSTAILVCLALTNSALRTECTIQQLPQNASSATITPASCDLVNAVLCGFDFDFGTPDRKIQTASVGVGISAPNAAGIASMTYTAVMQDGSGHQAMSNVTGGVLAAAAASTIGVQVRSFQCCNGDFSEAVTFPNPFSQACALLQSFNIQDANDGAHKANFITAGCSQTLIATDQANTVGLQGVLAEWDRETEKGVNSTTTFLVVAS